jgi:hypothetical protein
MNMNKFTATVLLMAALRLSASGQLTLNAGDVYSYEFSSLPGPTPYAGGAVVSGLVYLTLSPATLQAGNVLRYEMFEDGFSQAPIFSRTLTGPTDDSGPYVGVANGAWQDRQGAIRITALSGSATIDTIQLVSFEAGGRFGLQYYSSVLTPVPEPGTWCLLGVAGLAGFAARCRKNSGA